MHKFTAAVTLLIALLIPTSAHAQVGEQMGASLSQAPGCQWKNGTCGPWPTWTALQPARSCCESLRPTCVGSGFLDSFPTAFMRLARQWLEDLSPAERRAVDAMRGDEGGAVPLSQLYLEHLQRQALGPAPSWATLPGGVGP